MKGKDMTALEIQSSLVKTITEIDDIHILEQVKNAIKKIIPVKVVTKSQKVELTPFVQKMCFGHGLSKDFDEKKVLENELRKKYL